MNVVMNEPEALRNDRDIYSVIRRHAPTSLIQDLINAGTDINTAPLSATVCEFFGRHEVRCTPLYWAVVSHNEDAMKVLLHNRARQSIHSNTVTDGMRPIHVIGFSGGDPRYDNRLHILSTGFDFDPSAQDADGSTALHLAMQDEPRGCSLIRQLTDLGTDPCIRDTLGCTVFHYVQNRLQLRVLLNYSPFVHDRGVANCIHIPDNHGNTPMHWVAQTDERGTINLAKEFIKLNVSLFIKNNDGYTPVDVAIEWDTPVLPILEFALETVRLKSEAFFMGLQQRIGMHSVLWGFPPEIADAIAEEAMGIERDGRLEM
jgi:ankyrin repeat protein